MYLFVMSLKISLTIEECKNLIFHMNTGQTPTPGIFLTPDSVAGKIVLFLFKFPFKILLLH